jgi:poly(ribitol-phosphate) beta-N-acetylglucosaminyltransferase
MAATKVSVIVPVYNPGAYIDALLASLGRQSMPADEFEAIFVDDGSTDGTPERLEALAREVPNFRVIRIPPSGGPGKPRNVGVQAARGEYVQFVDNDDHLGDEALERLWNYAKANDSDVVVGKEVRPRSRRPLLALFRKNRPHATLEHDPLLDNLTPHKMFRRQFLLDNDIWFAHGARRLIDHAYVVKAYFRASAVSVLSDYACYYWLAPRPDRSNASLRPHVWKDWYGDMRAVLDVVEEHTEPGAFRDRLLAHWYAAKGLARIGGTLSRRSEGRPRELLEALRDLAEERFPPSVDQHLSGIMRVRSALLRAGDFDSIEALAAAERGMRVEYRLRDAPGPGFEVSAALSYRDGAPVLLEREGDRWYLIPPIDLRGTVPREALDVTDDLSRMKLDVIARHKQTGERIPLPGETRLLPAERRATSRLAATRSVRMDAKALARGRRLPPGVWMPRLQLRACGWQIATDLVGVPRTGRRRRLHPGRTAPEGRMSLVVHPTGEMTLDISHADRRRSRGTVAVRRALRAPVARVPWLKGARRRLSAARSSGRWPNRPASS